MDLKALFSITNRKGYNHFSGSTNSNSLFFSFSKSYNGRGESFDLELNNNDNSKITLWMSEMENLTDNDIFKIIEEKL